LPRQEPYAPGIPTQPLSLSDSQLDAVMRAAEPLLPLGRDPFLRAVAQRLRSEPTIGDGLVGRVCKELQREFMRHAPQLSADESRS
jgi:hypothetical protein